MATVSPSSLNIYVADKVVLNNVILTCGYLDQIEGLTSIRILNLSAFWDPWDHLKIIKPKFMLSR